MNPSGKNKTKGEAKRVLFKSPLLVILLASIIAAVYVYSLIFVTAFKNARFRFEDFVFRARHQYYSLIAKERLKPKDIVLVTIDEESYQKLEKRWPWGREVFADFLDKISKYKPRVISLDFALYGETPDNPKADAELAGAIKRAGNVIIASVYGRDKLYLGPHDIFAKASAGYGVIGAVRDEDNIIRRLKTFTLILSPQKGGDISFEVKTAAAYLGVPFDKIYKERDSIVLDSEHKRYTIPTDESGYIWINFLSDDNDIETVPIWQVMIGELPRNIFKDKLVLVSQTGEIFHDYHTTPMGYKSGGVIITNVLNSIISSSYLYRVHPNVSVPIITLIYLLALVLFHKSSPFKGFIILVLMLTTCLSISFSLFLKGIMLPTFYAVSLLPLLFLGITFYKYAYIVFEGAEIKQMAITDSLTDLYTHRYLRFLLEHTVNTALNFGYKCSFAAIKILNLDKVVKELSFNRGQMVQKRIAELIKMKLPRNGHGTYLGMGEFGMLMLRVGVDEALGIVGSLRDNIKEEDFQITDPALRPVLAIGVSAIRPKGFPKSSTELMRSARVAMGRAREMGDNEICKFNPEIDSSIFELDVMEKEIRQRLDDEFSFLAIDLEERNKELEDLLRQLSFTQRELEQAHFDTLRSMVVALEEKDPCTAGHSERVGDYAERIGKKLRMPEEELILLKQAGVLHDIGKVGISQDILRKEYTLDETERHIVELHPEFSVKILHASRYFSKILHAIRDHHERLDGSGYPRGLKGREISVEAQIIAICDVYDAMSADRPYRKALSPKETIDEILSHPEKYNRDIALLLKQILAEDHKLE